MKHEKEGLLEDPSTTLRQAQSDKVLITIVIPTKEESLYNPEILHSISLRSE